MCNPAAAVMAAGMAMQYKAQRDAASRADQQIGLGEDKNDAYNQNNINVIDENSQQYDSQTRQANIGKSQEAAVTSLRDFLDKGNEGRTNTDTTQGRVSETFIADRAKRAVNNANKADVVARLMAKMRGVSDLQTGEAINNANAASKIGITSGQQLNMARSNGIDVGQAGRPDAGLMLAGSAARGYGQGKMMSDFNMQKPTPTTYRV